MNVLHVTSSLSDGGAEAVLYRVVTNDESDLHYVISLTGDGKYGQLLREAGVTVTTLDMGRGSFTLQGLHRLLLAIRSWPADVMQTWMYHSDLLGGILGRISGTPVVWGLRNTVLEPGKSSLSTIWVARLCAWLSCWIPTRIVACAQAAVGVHSALGYDAERMVVIPNGYDLSLFVSDIAARKRLRADWGVSDSMPLIGMVARFDPYKDHTNLLAALTNLKAQGVDFRAVLVGTDVEVGNEVLMAKVKAEGLTDHVFLLGPRHDIPDIMSALDIHVLSSSAEAFPNVLAEAMACGTPCVTTDVGDAACIVGDTGWVVPPSNSQALAFALNTALVDRRCPTGWVDRQQRCRHRIASEYSMEKMVIRYREVWTEVATLRSA